MQVCGQGCVAHTAPPGRQEGAWLAGDSMPTQPPREHPPPGSVHAWCGPRKASERGNAFSPPPQSQSPGAHSFLQPASLSWPGKLRDVRVFGVMWELPPLWDSSGRDQQAGKRKRARTHQTSWRKSPTTSHGRALQTPLGPQSWSLRPLSAWHPSFGSAPLG